MMTFSALSSREGWIRLLLFILCIPSGGSLLLKVFGLAQMAATVRLLVLPSLALIGGVWWLLCIQGRMALASRITAGLLGGLAGTIGYDLIRVPFQWAGLRIFVPIRVYGVWIADASNSTDLTDALGWAYHLSNGLTFGLMYALVFRRGRVLWAVVWAVALETIAILSPFGRIFGAYRSWEPLAIAYLGHLAYGIPLGLVILRSEAVAQWQHRSRYRPVVWTTVAVGLVAVLLLGLARAPKKTEPVLVVQNSLRSLKPDIVRLPCGEGLRVENPTSEATPLLLEPSGEKYEIPAGQQLVVVPATPGISRLSVGAAPFSRRSFVLVEPVEAYATKTCR